MYKQLASITLIFSTLLSVLFPFVPQLEYLLHYDYIVEHHCINRNNPEVDCNGACYLKKHIQENSEDSHQPKSTNHQTEQQQIIPVFGIQNPTQELLIPTPCLRTLVLFYQNSYHNPFLQTLFRPPQG